MSDSEEEISVTRFKHEGVDYLKDGDDYLYDPKTSEVVGYWNVMTKEIEEVAEFGSDEESEDDSSDDDSDEYSHLTPRQRAEVLLAEREERGEGGEEEVRPIYGLIDTNPQYSKAEIEEMFSGDNVSYIDK